MLGIDSMVRGNELTISATDSWEGKLECGYAGESVGCVGVGVLVQEAVSCKLPRSVEGRRTYANIRFQPCSRGSAKRGSLSLVIN